MVLEWGLITFLLVRVFFNRVSYGFQKVYFFDGLFSFICQTSPFWLTGNAALFRL